MNRTYRVNDVLVYKTDIYYRHGTITKLLNNGRIHVHWVSVMYEDDDNIMEYFVDALDRNLEDGTFTRLPRPVTLPEELFIV